MGFFSRSSKQDTQAEAAKKELQGEPVYVPLEHPASGTVSQPEVPNDKTVSDEEKRKRYQLVLTHFQQPDLEYALSTEDDLKKVKLTPVEKAWLTKECFHRYLRACNWKADETIKRLENSIVWRRGYGISNGIFGHYDPEIKKYEIPELQSKTLVYDTIKHEAETGKQVLFGYDKGCRPCLYLCPGKENTKPSETQVQFLMFQIEVAASYMPQGQDKLALCVDFQDFPGIGLKSKPLPSVSVGKTVLGILQYHYPERLGRALFVNIPFVASVFLKLCWPFLDPYTKQKVSFDNPFRDFIPTEQLPYYYEDGEVNFQFNADTYMKGLIEIGTKKYKLYLDRFFELGAEVGLSEVDLRSDEAIHSPKSLKSEPQAAVNEDKSEAVAADIEKLQISDRNVKVQSQEVTEA